MIFVVYITHPTGYIMPVHGLFFSLPHLRVTPDTLILDFLMHVMLSSFSIYYIPPQKAQTIARQKQLDGLDLIKVGSLRHDKFLVCTFRQ